VLEVCRRFNANASVDASTAFLMMERASTSEAPVRFYQAARRNNPEDRNLCTRRRENLMSPFPTLYSVVIT
jgi:hypothetical protein